LQHVNINPASFMVVRTKVEMDETALKLALMTSATYIGFVASKKKREDVFEYLKNSDIDAKRIGAIKSPVGIDSNAKKPEALAISILAEIIQELNSIHHPSILNILMPHGKPLCISLHCSSIW
jgi:xanthine dehydrogenase accessory factor